MLVNGIDLNRFFHSKLSRILFLKKHTFIGRFRVIIKRHATRVYFLHYILPLP